MPRSYDYDPYAERRRLNFSRSGWLTAVIIGVVLLGFGVAWHLHQRAKFHQLTTHIIPQTTSAPAPGGQEAILLSRVALLNDSEPEFVSLTALPGVGMQTLQVTAAIPDQNTRDLFASAPLSEAARLSVDHLAAAPFHLRVGTRHLQERTGDDLLGTTPATKAANQTLVDGGQATGTFAERNGVTASVETTLAGRIIDVLVRATNQGEENRFVAFDWTPLFLAPGGHLERMTLMVPSRAVMQNGSSQAVEGSALDLSSGDGVSLGSRDLDATYVKLSHEFLGDGAAVRLLDLQGRYVLRMVGMGETVRSVRVQTEPTLHAVRLSFSSQDPSADAESRDQVLRPGQTLQWHLRMEIQPVKATGMGADETATPTVPRA